MRTSDTTAELFTAMSKASAELENPVASETAKVKTKTGADYSYKYVSLADLAAQIRTCLSAHGLAVLQEALDDNGNRIGVTTRIVHSSGEWIELGPLTIPAGQGAQEHGSALTYARRYALTAAFTLAPDEDDDGAKAQQEVRRSGAAQHQSQPQARTSAGVTGPAEQALGGGDNPASVTGKGSGSDSGSPPSNSKTCAHVWRDAPRQGFEVCATCGEARRKEKAVLS